MMPKFEYYELLKNQQPHESLKNPQNLIQFQHMFKETLEQMKCSLVR